MTLTFRPLQRCDRCRSPHRPRCERLRTDLSRLVTQAAIDAAQAGDRLPEAEVVLDCAGFDWRGKGEA